MSFLHEITQNTISNDVTQESYDVIQNPTSQQHNHPMPNDITQSHMTSPKDTKPYHPSHEKHMASPQYRMTKAFS